MPYVRKSKNPRKPRKAYRKKRRAVYRRKTVAPMETACLKQTLILEDLSGNQPYEAQINLTSFSRALDVADNYQQYRIAKVEYIYKPKFDTFVTSPNTNSVPYLYAKVLSYPAPVTFGLQFLTTMGVKPRRLDDKTLKMSYRPHILQSGIDAIAQGTTTQNYTRVVKSPWLNTHVTDSSGTVLMDNTTHYGHVFWLDLDQVGSDPISICQLEVNVYFEFIKPWDLKAQVPPPGTPNKVVIQPHN